jgi:hypothetical protein
MILDGYPTLSFLVLTLDYTENRFHFSDLAQNKYPPVLHGGGISVGWAGIDYFRRCPRPIFLARAERAAA